MMLAALPALAAGLVLAAASAKPFDVIIAGGRVVDGSGAPWLLADVGIRGDRIAAIGDLSGEKASRRIDATGKVVSPGFIDMLGQSEFYVLVDGRVESKIRQGFTTEITGESFTVAPVSPASLREAKPFLDKYKLAVDWTDLAGYFRRFEKNRSAVNLGTLVGLQSLRMAVVGLEDVSPTADQLRRMEEQVEKAMKQGALGFSSALIYTPDAYAKTAELVALAKVAARYGGVYATHIRGEGDQVMSALEEAITVGKEAAIPVEVWHLKVSGRENWGRMKEVLARIEAARSEGVDVGANMYPYTASCNYLDANVPEWAHAGGVDAMISRFHDPAQRSKISAALWKTGMGIERPEDILLTSTLSADQKQFLGKRLSEVAKESAKTPEDALLDLVEQSRATLLVVRFGMSDADVRLGLASPAVSIGSDCEGQALDGPTADQASHPRCFGTAARFLGRYGRDEKLFGLEEGIRRLTSLPARRMHLWDRGLLRSGMAADVTVLDPAKLRDAATFEKPAAYAEGVEFVLVNGKVVLDGGKLTSERPGKALRGAAFR